MCQRTTPPERNMIARPCRYFLGRAQIPSTDMSAQNVPGGHIINWDAFSEVYHVQSGRGKIPRPECTLKRGRRRCLCLSRMHRIPIPA